jgi:hypothetical protein
LDKKRAINLTHNHGLFQTANEIVESDLILVETDLSFCDITDEAGAVLGEGDN